MSKNQIRRDALRSRRSLGKTEVDSMSGEVARRLFGLPEYSSARTIASYVAKSDEVQTSDIIETALEEGKMVLVPRSDPTSTLLFFSEITSLSDLSLGHFGILEPPASFPAVPLDTADLVLVPVVAWDHKGHRLGFGMGYFDRALGSNRRPISVGLAFESQRFEELPQTSVDVPLDIVVTESRVMRFGGKGDDR